MATVGRLQLAHPALGTAGGPALHASIESLYEKIGDNVADRYFALTDFDNGETVDLFHNYNTDMGNLRLDLYYLSGGEWVRITSTTTPARSAFTIIEKVGFEATTLQITNVSGGNNLEVIVVMTNDNISLSEGDVKDIDITTTAPENEQPLVYNSTTGKHVPGYPIEVAYKLMGIAANVVTIKAGTIILSDGRELHMAADAVFNLKTAVNTAGVTAPSATTAYYLYLYLTALPSETSVGSTDRKVYAIASGTSGQFIVSATKPQSIDQSIFVPIASLKTDGSSNYTEFANLARRTHSLPMSSSSVTSQLINPIINGGMHLWQRNNSSIAAINDSQMGVDRFRFRKANTTGVFTVSRESSIVPTASQAGASLPYSLKIACTTADASVAATDTVSFQYCVEGFPYGLHLHNKTARLQFWVYSNKTGTYCVGLRNSAQDRAYVVEYTINVANTWEFKSFDITFNSSGTWLFDSSIGLCIDWTLMAGSTAQTTANAWNTVTAANNVKATSNQANFADSNTNVWYLAGVQLIPGSFGPAVLPFFMSAQTIGEEIRNCQRYYSKSYNIDVNVATVTDVGATSGIIGTTSIGKQYHQFPVFMRATPSVSTYDPVNGTNNAARMGSSSEGVSHVNIGMRGYGISGGGSLTDTAEIKSHFAADAELLATL